MSTPTIPDGRPYMQVSTYTGTGASNAISTTAQLSNGAMIWTKTTSNVVNWDVHSSAGTQTYSFLQTNTTNAEDSSNSNYSITYANGSYTLGSGDNINQSGRTFVGYQWAAGASASNTSGSITSTTRVNATAGFSVVTYTGTGSTATVGHGLGVAPSLVIAKCKSLSATGWPTYHVSYGKDYVAALQSTSAFSSAASYWGAANPTSTVFGLGSGGNDNNISGGTYVAYCWAPIAGYSAFGSYVGNGSTDGPFIYTGFRPKFILTKRASTAGAWHIYNTTSSPYNQASVYVVTNSSDAQYSGDNQMDVLSNGFKLRSTNTGTNESGATIIYAAFAENPFKYANAR